MMLVERNRSRSRCADRRCRISHRVHGKKKKEEGGTQNAAGTGADQQARLRMASRLQVGAGIRWEPDSSFARPERERLHF